MAVRKNRPNEIIWMARPPMTMYSPIFTVSLLVINEDDAPCTQNERISPMINALVTQVIRIRERCSPFTQRIIRPRVIYIEAAKRAGEMMRNMV